METPTEGEPAGSNGSGPPSEDYILSGEGLVGAGTGPANSAAMDLGSPAATTLGLTNVVSKRGSEVATGRRHQDLLRQAYAPST